MSGELPERLKSTFYSTISGLQLCDLLIDHLADLVKSSSRNSTTELAWITSHITAVGRVKQCLADLASEEKPK